MHDEDTEKVKFEEAKAKQSYAAKKDLICNGCNKMPKRMLIWNTTTQLASPTTDNNSLD